MQRITAFSVLALVVAAVLLAASVGAMAATEQAKRVAIDDGLVWLIGQQVVSGDEGYWSYDNNGTLAATAAVALAFIEDGYLPGENVIIGLEPDTTAYGDVVGRAVNYIFNRATIETRFGVETAGYWHYAEDYNNDGIAGNDGGNDQAIYFEPGEANRRLYTTGICTPVVFALGEALGIDTVIDRGSAAVNGRTYAEVMQDLVDWFCFAQVEPTQGNYRGGWRYDANYSSSDNSTAQWGSLPLLYADSWGLPTPDYVYAELALWVDYIQNDNGGSGYSDPNEYVNVAKTGGLLLELAAIRAGFGDSRVQDALAFINGRWNDTPSSTWYGNLNHPYAMWAVYKGLEVYELMDVFESDGRLVRFGFGMPAAPGGFEIGRVGDTRISDPGDWYSHYCQYLVDIQNANGGWSGYDHWWGPLATGWYLNILRGSPGVHRPADPDIQITSIADGECVWYGTGVTHTIRYWFGSPGHPDTLVPPAEDVVVTVVLDPDLTFISATGDYELAGDDTLIWRRDSVPDGDEYFETIVTEGAATVDPLTELVTFASISASNVPEELWDHDESRLMTCGINCVQAHVGEPMFDADALHLTVPIVVENVVPLEPVTGIDLFFYFDPMVLDVVDVTFEETLLEGLGWASFWNEPVPGEFRLGLAGTDPIPDDGVLVYLEFDLAPTAPCDGCTVLDLEMLLNEGDPCVLIDDSDWCIPLADVTGTVTFWGCGMVGNDYPPIPDVIVTSTNSCHSDTACSDEDGVFWLSACHESCYTMTPSKPCGETEGISPLDAAMILRYFVGLEELDECPIESMEMYDGGWCPEEDVYPAQVAADVTDNGEIHSFDASVILKYIVGQDVSDYLVGCWRFYCESRYFCADDDPTEGMDFVGLLYGDVTGNYGLVFPPADSPASGAGIAVATVDGDVGESVGVPVSLVDADGFYGLQFKVLYDTEFLLVQDVQPSDMAEGALFEWYAQDGELRLAFAKPDGFDGDGELCRISFYVNGFPGTASCLLDLQGARADEDPGLLSMTDGAVVGPMSGVDQGETLPASYGLHAAVPNPFNPVTAIRYDVPIGGGDVLIEICDVRGRVVKTLVSEWEPAGTHLASWYGVDASDRSVASGVYFCRMVAGDQVFLRKLTLLK